LNDIKIDVCIVEFWEKMPSRYGCVTPHPLHNWELVASQQTGFTAICVNYGCESIHWYGGDFRCWKELWLPSKAAKEFDDALVCGLPTL